MVVVFFPCVCKGESKLTLEVMFKPVCLWVCVGSDPWGQALCSQSDGAPLNNTNWMWSRNCWVPGISRYTFPSDCSVPCCVARLSGYLGTKHPAHSVCVCLPFTLGCVYFHVPPCITYFHCSKSGSCLQHKTQTFFWWNMDSGPNYCALRQAT